MTDENEIGQEENSSDKRKPLIIAGISLAVLFILTAVILTLVKTPQKVSEKTVPEAFPPTEQNAAPDNTNSTANTQKAVEKPLNVMGLAGKYGFDLENEDIQKKINLAKGYADNWDKNSKLTGFIGVYNSINSSGNLENLNKVYMVYFVSGGSQDKEKKSDKDMVVILDGNNSVIGTKNNETNPIVSQQMGYVLLPDVRIGMAEAFTIAAKSLDRSYLEMPSDNKDNLDITLGLGYNKKEGYVWQYDFRKKQDLLARVSIKADTGKVILRYPAK